jgi:hypothetical protein
MTVVVHEICIRPFTSSLASHSVEWLLEVDPRSPPEFLLDDINPNASIQRISPSIELIWDLYNGE